MDECGDNTHGWQTFEVSPLSCLTVRKLLLETCIVVLALLTLEGYI